MASEQTYRALVVELIRSKLIGVQRQQEVLKLQAQNKNVDSEMRAEWRGQEAAFKQLLTILEK